jgi:hypothetical protein
LNFFVDDQRRDKNIHYLTFNVLQDYQPAYWFYEIIDIYRRIIFIAVLPLIGANVDLQATAACLLSVVFIVVSSELSPFRRKFTNMLNTVAQYQV